MAARSYGRSLRFVAPRFVAVPVVMVAVSAVTITLCQDSPQFTVIVVALVSATVAVSSGVGVLQLGWGNSSASVFRRWFGAAMVTWGIGELLRAIICAAGSQQPFPSVGDFVNIAAVPLAAAGVLTIPRQVGGSHPVVRITLDAGLLSVVAGLLMWRLTFVSPSAPPLDGTRAAAALGLLLEVGLCAMFVVTAVRDLETHLILVAAGVVGFALGDVLILQSDPEAILPPTWGGRALWVFAWPLIAWATLRYDPGGRAGDEPGSVNVDPDARVTVVTTIVSLLLLGAGVALIILQAPALPEPLGVDPVSWALIGTAIGLLSTREFLNARLRMRLLARLHDEAMSDPLTGLANRRMLTSRLADVQNGELWCLIAIDLDGFKGVNDLLGHAVGDRLLCAVGNRLVRNLPRTAVVSRTGGDEFAVLMPGRLQEGVAAAEVVLAAVRRSCWDVEGVTRLPVTASVGVTAVGGPYPVAPPAAEDDGADPLSALSAAGAALQLAKAAGRDRIEVFDGAAALIRQRRLSVEERLRAAIRAGELDVRFQPVVDLRSGAISGVEALARWVDPRLGRINPQEFIPVAEQTGLVVGLGELVLHRTLDQATQHGLPQRGIRVACNVSPLQLRVPGFPQLVEDALAAYAMPPRLLLVEVTEAVLVEEDGPGVRALRRLADAGVTIAIDDFGTGYSALGYLRRLPAHVLKIDRSLTSALIDEPEARAITRAVIELGGSLKVDIVVEGIETSDVAELVTSMGANYGQGTLYGSAMPMSDVVRLSRRPLSGIRLA